MLDPTASQLLTEVIEEYYTDGIDKIIDAEDRPDGSIVVLAVDGRKQLAIKITEQKIAIKILNPLSATAERVQLSLPSIKDLADFSWDDEPDNRLEVGLAEQVQVDTAEVLADRLRPIVGDYVDQWVQALQLAFAEADSYKDLQERITGIINGMAEAREDLTVQYKTLSELGYLAGIFEGEQEVNG